MATENIKTTSDPAISKNEFVLLLNGREVGGGSIEMIYDFLDLFDDEAYDEIAVHPKYFHLLQAMGG
jgi:aspartyl-tRNA synthetase